MLNATKSPSSPLGRSLSLALLACVLACVSSNATEPGQPPVLQGRVVSSGLAVAGASVELVRAGPGLRVVTHRDTDESLALLSRDLTNAAGEFEVDASGAGAAALVVRAAGRAAFLSRREFFPLGSPTPAQGVVIDLGEAVAVEGAILDAQGGLVADASVRAVARTWDGEWWTQTTSNKRGQHVLQGLPKHARVEILSRKNARAARDVRWTSSQPVRCSLFLEPTETLRGRLLQRGANGAEPVTDALIHVAIGPLDRASDVKNHPSGRKGASDHHDVVDVMPVAPDGSYDITLGPGARAMASRPGSAWTLLEGGDEYLGGAPVQHLSVANASGKPLSRAKVRTKALPWFVELDEHGQASWSPPRQDRWLEILDARFPEAVSLGRGSRLSLQGPWTLTGRVELTVEGDEPTTAAVSVGGARVRARLVGGTVLEVTSHSDGRFEIPGLPPGDVMVSASKGALVAHARGSASRPLLLELQQAPAVSLGLAERKVDEQAAPSGGGVAEVLLVSDRSSLAPRRLTVSTTATVIDGLGDLEWQAVYWGEELAGGVFSLRAGADAAKAQLLPAGRPTAVDVLVRDTEGRALPHAHVDFVPFQYHGDRREQTPFTGGQRSRATTDTAGRARVSSASGSSRMLQVRLAGFATGFGKVEKTAQPVVVTLARVARLSGLVLGPDLEPVAGATLSLNVKDVPSLDDKQVKSLQGSFEGMKSNAEGRFELPLTAGLFGLKAGHPRFLATEEAEVELRSGQTVELTLTLLAGASLRGRVSSADGTPAPGAKVIVEVEADVRNDYFPPGLPTSLAGKDGQFLLEGLIPQSEVTVHATLDGDRSPPRRAFPGDEPVELELVALGVIEGVVKLEGMPVAARVTCAERKSRRANTDPTDGSYRIDGLPEGAYNCTAKSEDGIHVIDGVALPEGEVATLDFELRRFHELALRIVADDDGEPFKGAHVSIEDERSQRTDAEGRAVLKLNPAIARQHVQAGHASLEGVQRTVESPFPDNLELRLKRRSSIRLSGNVLDDSGSPLPDAKLDGIAWGKTEADGTFALTTYQQGHGTLRAVVLRDGERLSGKLDLELVPGQDKEGLRITLAPTPQADLRLTVMDDGAPAPNVKATLVRSADGVGVRGTTDESGVAEITSVPMGRWKIDLARTGQNKVEAGELAVTGTGTIEHTVEFPEGWTLTGRVLRHGEPVEAAMIKVDAGMDILMSPNGHMSFGGGGVRAIRSSRDGSFELGPLDAATATTRIEVKPPEPALPGDRTLVYADVATGQDQPVTIDLAGSMVSGRVSFQGRPVVGASVTAKPRGKDSAQGTEVRFASAWIRHADRSARTYTDTEGTYVLAGLEHDLPHDLVVAKSGMATVVRAFDSTRRELTIDVALERPGALRLQALGPGGTPSPASFMVQLETADGRRIKDARARPTEDGFHELDVSAETYSYRATRAGWADQLGTIEPGNTEVLTWDVGGRLELVVTRDGRPVRGARARAVSLDGAPVDGHIRPDWLGRWADRLSNDAGKLAVDRLPVGTLTVDVSLDDRSVQASAQLVSGTTSTVEVELADQQQAGQDIGGTATR